MPIDENLFLDDSEILFKELNRSIVNLYKLCFEEMGYDLYTSENQVEYHNYLINCQNELGEFSISNYMGLPSGSYPTFMGGSSGMFTGKSAKEKFAMCGCDMIDWRPSTARAKGLITKINIPCRPGIIEFNKYGAPDLVAILQEINKLGWFNCYISSAHRDNYSAGGKSRHQVGLAVDINAGGMGNPWYKMGSKFNISVPQHEPQQGVKAPWDRHPKYSGRMYDGGYDRSKCIWSTDHPVVRIFKAHGWGWGGTYGDVMHFSIDGA